MQVAIFSTKRYEEGLFATLNESVGHRLTFLDVALSERTAPLAKGFPCVCAFVNDDLSQPVLEQLASGGTKLLALRSAGFNHVDLPAAKELGFIVVRVPAYSPYAVAEHTIAMILALNRKIHKAYNRVREANFSLDGLLGFDLHGKTVGVVGTGKIGRVTANILHGFGCRALAYDLFPNDEARAIPVEYVPLRELIEQSDIISLHCPLTKETHHLIDDEAIRAAKPGVMLINTSRGGLVDTRAVIQGLKSGKIGSLGLDVYEEEAGLFFEDLSRSILQDDVFARLLTFPNVLITGHQAFFTKEALDNIIKTTLGNIRDVETKGCSANQIQSS